jgi:HPt (histidine-containing phosphotransfer) domain-containing protein
MDASGGNREVAVSLVQLYFELTGGEMTRMAEAISGNCPETVSAIAHKCAGSSISCGMIRLADLLKTLETSSAQVMPADAPGQLEEIQKEMSAMKTAFETHFNCSIAP